MKPAFRLLLTMCLWIAVSSGLVSAHEVRPAIADVTVGPDEATIQITMSVEPLLAGMDLAGLMDTNESPLSDVYDAYRAQPAAQIAAEVQAAWPQLQAGFLFQVNGQLLPASLQGIEVPKVGNVDLPRDSILSLSVALPEGESPVSVGWASEYGPLIVRQMGEGDEQYSGYLEAGALSDPLPREGVAQISTITHIVRYVVLGFEHILPKGLDHILFVLGLFFFSLQWRPLLVQVSAFTLAHTVTLAMAIMGVVTVSPAVVEPLIAASIVYVAVENILRPKLGWWRTVVVFGFGLLHGLGFASVLGEIGLDPARLVTGLISFNVGVEIGQLTVISVAFLLLGVPFGRAPWYRKFIAIPASLAIAAVGTWWVIERTLL